MRYFNLVISLIILFGTTVESRSDVHVLQERASPPTQSATIAVLPFANYTGNSKAKLAGDSLIFELLIEQGWNVIPRDSLRDVLRKHRIRTKNGINIDQAAAIRDELSADYFLIGTYNIYIENDIPEVGFSIHLVDTENLKIAAAFSAAANGEDFSGFLGIGRITSIDVLYKTVIAKAFVDINPPKIELLKTRPKVRSAGRMAIVPFDNFSPDRNAGLIVSSMLIAELTEAGWDIVSPGDVFQLFRLNNRIPRGEIDFDLLKQMTDKLNVDFVITGSVFEFTAGMAGIDGSVPEIELSGRLIESRTGRIISTESVSARGSDSELFFRSGTCYSLGKLTRKALRDLRNKIAGERIAHFANKE